MPTSELALHEENHGKKNKTEKPFSLKDDEKTNKTRNN